ncbi:MAG: class I SAM-dependent methyltransferase [Planctomycetota bacterium]
MKISGSGKFKKEKIYSRAGQSLLEVGCGEGKYIGFALSLGKEAVGIDISSAVVNKASKEFGDFFLLADALNVPFADNSFDTVCLWDVLEHVTDDSIALQEAVRVAKKNVLISVPKEDAGSDFSAGITYRTYTDSSHLRYYTKEKIENLMQKTGVKSFEIEEFDRIRPMLAYGRAGVPRCLLSAFDRAVWLFCLRKSAMFRNFYVLVDLNK